MVQTTIHTTVIASNGTRNFRVIPEENPPLTRKINTRHRTIYTNTNRNKKWDGFTHQATYLLHPTARRRCKTNACFLRDK
mmetsp:Transcript_34826/g.68553  ORF Transcript_34826/g.68553 Transcript_34826/m.68553 type:complete len:80 (+) Transcript_34826:231-470(+)